MVSEKSSKRTKWSEHCCTEYMLIIEAILCGLTNGEGELVNYSSSIPPFGFPTLAIGTLTHLPQAEFRW